MAQVLKVGERDFSSFIQNAHDAGLDPANSEYSVPQFSGAPALGEGQSFVADAVGNRLQSYPLILKASNTDALYQLVRDINGELKKGEQVEYRSGGASQSTFFDLERGQLKIQFEYWLDQAARARCMLHLWTRPFGHSGTTRLVASILGTGPQILTASGMVGDVPAQGKLRVAMASRTALEEPLLIYGLKHPVPSGWSPIYTPAHLASTLTKPLTPATASSFGASGRLASQYRGFAVVPTTTANPQALFQLPLREADSGRYRALLSVRHLVSSADGKAHPSAYLQLSKHDAVSNENNDPVRLTSIPLNRWRIVDFGEITIDIGLAQYFKLGYMGASGATAIATYPIQCDGGILLPVDQGAGILIGDQVESSFLPAASYSVELDAIERQVLVKGASPGGEQILAEQTGRLRGNFPLIPAGDGAAQILVWGGAHRGSSGTDQEEAEPLAWSIAARERFTYLR